MRLYNPNRSWECFLSTTCANHASSKLEKRIHKVKMEMGVEEGDYEQYKEAIRGSFVEGTHHLKKSREKGDDARDRLYRNMRLLLLLAILAAIYWFLYLR